MRASGNWIVPTFNGAPRYDKPPLIYWLQAGACAVFGENDFAVRFPSAVCAALTALVVAIWGARLSEAVTGLRAGVIFTLCLQTAIHARGAVADFPMILALAFSAWAGWESLAAVDSKARRLWWLACWVALALGFLAKGPIALVPIGMLALARGPALRRWGILEWLGGSAIALALIGAWGIPALQQTQGEFAAVGLGKHVVARSVVALEGHGAKSLSLYLATLPLYFLTIWPCAFPWSLWLVPATRHYWQRQHRQPLDQYLLTGTILVFGIFTLSRTKLPHYILPAFPFLALLLARWWREKRSTQLFWRTANWTAAVLALVLLVFPPIVAKSTPSWQLYQAARSTLPAGTAWGAIGYREPSLVWYFRHTLHGWMEPLDDDELTEWMNQPGPRAVILPTELARRSYPETPAGWQHWKADGWHLTKGKRTSITLLYRP